MTEQLRRQSTASHSALAVYSAIKKKGKNNKGEELNTGRCVKRNFSMSGTFSTSRNPTEATCRDAGLPSVMIGGHVLERLHKLFRRSACYLQITPALYRSACTAAAPPSIQAPPGTWGHLLWKDACCCRGSQEYKRLKRGLCCKVTFIFLRDAKILRLIKVGFSSAAVSLTENKDQESQPPAGLVGSPPTEAISSSKKSWSLSE